MHKIDMENKDYIIGIDVGSSNVVMAVGVRNDNGEISVLGVDVEPIEDGCVKDGDIINYIQLGNAINKAKTALESELKVRLNSAYVGISGRSVYCVRYEDYVEINEKTGSVTENELRELNARIEMVVPGGGDEIIERIPLRYTIDDNQSMRDPLGAFGRKLSATYLFVLAGKHQIDRLNRALYQTEIKVSGLCVSPTLLPELVLTPDEMEPGVAIVDIGSDLTDISIVREGKLWYFSSLPIGASSINDDLQDFLKIPKKDIDLLKRRWGSAIADSVPSDTTVPVKMAGHAKKQILQRNIAEIIEERLKDIARFVERELKTAKFSTKIPCGVVLTGGSSYLSNIDQLFARELGMEVRFATMLNKLDDESQERVLAFPQSVALGLLLYGAKHNACEIVHEMPAKEVAPTPVAIEEEKPKDIFSPIEPVERVAPQPQPTPVPQPEPEYEAESEPQTEPMPTEEHTEEQEEQQEDDDKKNDKEDDKSGNSGNNGGKSGRNWWGRVLDWVDNSFVSDKYI